MHLTPPNLDYFLKRNYFLVERRISFLTLSRFQAVAYARAGGRGLNYLTHDPEENVAEI